MKPALIRLPLRLGVALLLGLVAGSGVALAGNPTRNQYVEVVPTVHHTTTTTTRHTSTGAVKPQTTSTAVTPTTTPVMPSTVTSSSLPQTTTSTPHRKSHRHRKATRKTKKSSNKPVISRRARALSTKPTSGATGLTAAAATGSGGGMGVWLLVILILVLVAGSAAGILRYRRTR